MENEIVKYVILPIAVFCIVVGPFIGAIYVLYRIAKKDNPDFKFPDCE